MPAIKRELEEIDGPVNNGPKPKRPKYSLPPEIIIKLLSLCVKLFLILLFVLTYLLYKTSSEEEIESEQLSHKGPHKTPDLIPPLPSLQELKEMEGMENEIRINQRGNAERRMNNGRMNIDGANDNASTGIPRRRIKIYGDNDEDLRRIPKRHGPKVSISTPIKPKKKMKRKKSHKLIIVINAIRNELRKMRNYGHRDWNDFKSYASIYGYSNEIRLMENILWVIRDQFYCDEAWSGSGPYLGLPKILIVFPTKILCDSFDGMVDDVMRTDIEHIQVRGDWEGATRNQLERSNIISACPGRLKGNLKKEWKRLAITKGLGVVLMWDYPKLNRKKDYGLVSIEKYLFPKGKDGPMKICVGDSVRWR